MDIALCILAIIAGVVGIVGSVVPGIPGPPISWIGLLLVYFFGGTVFPANHLSLTLLIIMLVVTVVVTLMDFVFPASMTKVTGGTPYAARGALAGLIIGIIFTPVGMLLGCFLGAMVSELYWGGRTLADSAKSAVGAFLGVFVGVGVKLLACGIMFWMIIVNL